MDANAYYNAPNSDLVTETVSRREDYGDPREETEVLIDENGVSKTVTKRIVTKTVTERRVRQVEEHDSLPRNYPDSRNGVNHHSDQDRYDSLQRRRSSSYEYESRGLLQRQPSESSSGSDRGRQPVGYTYTAPDKQSRPAQPEKFQAEDYGLEDDRRSDYSDEADQYGLEPGSGGFDGAPRRRSESSQSMESETQRYDEQLDTLPMTSHRGEVPRAPLATQEAGSKASLDRIDDSAWKTPTLQEVIKMLSYNMPVVQKNAAGYLQHLCYNNDDVKAEVRKLDGIPPLIKLLDHSSPQVEQNACGALRNLSFGSRNDKNKIEIKKHEGVPAVVRLIRSTKDIDTKEQATGTLWNLSAHPELKGQVLELGLEPLTNSIIMPYADAIAGGDSKPKEIVMVDVFTNAVGVIRNLSSTDSQDNRRKLRQCEGLIFALFRVLEANRENQNINNKATENCLCVLSNLTYKLQDETPNGKENYTLERSRDQASNEKSSTGCFGKKTQEKPPEVVEEVPPNDPEATGAELLWQPDNSRLYVALLQDTNRDEIIEAALGALLNLTSGVWQWAIYARTVVRKEKGLPVVIDRLRTNNDQIVRAGAITLTNLAEDYKNKELIGKFAMKDLVYKLPGGTDTSVRLSDTTTIAVLNTVRILVEKSPDNVRHLREAGGVEKISTINNARDSTRFHGRVVKASGQVLVAVWANKQTRSLLKSDGWNKNHFVPTVTADTLPRNPNKNNRNYEEPRSAPTSTGGRRAASQASQDQTELTSPEQPLLSAEATPKEKTADSWV